METQSIKVNIQGKEYAMNVEPESVKAMEKAAEMVNVQIKTFASSYAVKDNRDLLAMCALQLAFQLIEKDSTEKISDEALDKSLKDIEKALGIPAF
jgi:cell division protein ZapA (FtsZ GTPase activity inhibitor)